MEQGLRDCCRSIRLGKILIQSDEDTHEARSVYAKVPYDVCRRKVLLMYPIMSKSSEHHAPRSTWQTIQMKFGDKMNMRSKLNDCFE